MKYCLELGSILSWLLLLRSRDRVLGLLSLKMLLIFYLWTRFLLTGTCEELSISDVSLILEPTSSFSGSC